MILRQLFKIILSHPIPHQIHLKFSQILPPQTHQLFKCWGYLRDGFLVPSSCLVLLTCFIGVINIGMEIFRHFTEACSLTTLWYNYFFIECEDLIYILKLILQSKAGSQVYLHEVCRLLEKRIGTECSYKWTTDLILQAFKDADPPVQRKRTKAPACHSIRTNLYP